MDYETSEHCGNLDTDRRRRKKGTKATHGDVYADGGGARDPSVSEGILVWTAASRSTSTQKREEGIKFENTSYS